MSPRFRIAAATALCAVAATPAGAQTAPPARTASAASSAEGDHATAAAFTYRSAFEGFNRFGEQPVGPWRDANDVVGRVGGWKSYAREAQGSAPAPRKGHSGHEKP